LKVCKRTVSPLLLCLIITALCLPLVSVHAQNVDFKLTANPTQITLEDFGTATYYLSIIPIGGFNSTVNLQVTRGLPFGAQASIEPASVTPGIGHSVLTVLTSGSYGSYNITITGVSSPPTGSIKHSVVVGLTVVSGIASFTMEAIPAVSWGPQGTSGGLRLSQGQCGNYTISATSIGNFGGSVNLTVTNQLSHVAMRFAQNPLTVVPGGVVSTILQVCAAADAQPGNYTFTVVGTSNVSPLLHGQPATETHTVDILLRVESQTNTQRPTGLWTVLLTAQELIMILAVSVISVWLLALIAISLRRRRFAGRSAAGFGLILLGLSWMLMTAHAAVYDEYQLFVLQTTCCAGPPPAYLVTGRMTAKVRSREDSWFRGLTVRLEETLA
jgi:hypothetical protein